MGVYIYFCKVTVGRVEEMDEEDEVGERVGLHRCR